MTNPFGGNGNGGGQPATVIPFPGSTGQQPQFMQQPAQPQQQPIPQTQIVRDQGGISYDPRFLPPVQPAQQQHFGQHQFQGQQLQQPQQQPAPQPNAGQIQLTEATVLDGPGVPVELRGRTWAEMNRIYTGLRDIALQAQSQPRIPQPQAIPQQQVAPAAPTQWGQPQNQQGTPAPSQQQQPGSFSQADFLRNPQGAVQGMIQHELQAAFQNVLLPALAPITQQTNHLGTQNAMSTVAAEIGATRFQAMLPQIQEQLRGVDPRALVNPEMWRIAARSVAGNFALQGQPIPGQPEPQYTFATPAGGYPVQMVPQSNPVPGLGSFFSEQPGQGNAGGVGGIVLSPAERHAARMMQMSEADYAAWKGGVARG